MKRTFLILLLVAACREPSPPPGPAPTPPAAARLPELEKRVRTLEEHIAKVGLRVPAQLPASTARQVIETDAARAEATATPEIDPPRKGKVPWKSRVVPAPKVWQVATAAIGPDATAPPRLLTVVDQSGFLDGYFPVIPAEDLATVEGTPEQRLAALERNAQVLEGRRAVLDEVTGELDRQRRMIAAAIPLEPRHLRIDPGSRRAMLTFADVASADRAAASPLPAELGLAAKGAGTRLELTVPAAP